MAIRLSYIYSDELSGKQAAESTATYLGIGQTGSVAIEALEFIPNDLAKGSNYNILNICESWSEKNKPSWLNTSIEEETAIKMCKEAEILFVFMDINSIDDARHAQKMVEIYRSNGNSTGSTICVSVGTKLINSEMLTVFDSVIFVGNNPELLSIPANIMLFKEVYGQFGIDCADIYNTIRYTPIMYFIQRSSIEENAVEECVQGINTILNNSGFKDSMNKILHFESPKHYGIAELEELAMTLADEKDVNFIWQHHISEAIKECTVSLVFGIAANKDKLIEK